MIKKATAGAASLLILMLCLPAVSVAADDLNWLPYSKGMEKGERLGKDIFINFYGAWCQYCQMMDENTFRDPEVIDYLNQHFVLVKVDVDKAKRLADAYFVRGLPMGWFVSPEGEKLAPLPGYVPPDEFLTILKYIHTDAYEDHSYHEWMEMGGGK